MSSAAGTCFASYFLFSSGTDCLRRKPCKEQMYVSNKIRERVLTGDRPTGKLHLGHYVGTLKNRVRLQDTAELFIVIADYHALTTQKTRAELAQVADHIHAMVLDYLSIGIDPKKATIYVQSDVPQVCELQLILSMLVSVAQAQRIPTLKDVIGVGNLESPSMGGGATENPLQGRASGRC